MLKWKEIWEKLRRFIDNEDYDEIPIGIEQVQKNKSESEVYLQKLLNAVENILEIEITRFPDTNKAYIPEKFVVFISEEANKNLPDTKRKFFEQGLSVRIFERAKEMAGRLQLTSEKIIVQITVKEVLEEEEVEVRAISDNAQETIDRADSEKYKLHQEQKSNRNEKAKRESVRKDEMFDGTTKQISEEESKDKYLDNIYYFGCSSDGFNMYPSHKAGYNPFAGYDGPGKSGWMLEARKLDDITRYIYVTYGLLTSESHGRGGSLFGISIDFINHYFTDLRVLHEIMQRVWKSFNSEERLLQKVESGKVAFKVHKLSDISAYLDVKSQRIKEALVEEYSSYIIPSDEIVNVKYDSIIELHPDSSSKVINDYFKIYGGIKLTPNSKYLS